MSADKHDSETENRKNFKRRKHGPVNSEKRQLATKNKNPKLQLLRKSLQRENQKKNNESQKTGFRAQSGVEENGDIQRGDGLNETRKVRKSVAFDELQLPPKNKDPKLKLFQKLLQSEYQKKNDKSHKTGFRSQSNVEENGNIQQGKGDGLNEIRKVRKSVAADERQFSANNKDPKSKLFQKLLQSEYQKKIDKSHKTGFRSQSTDEENGNIQQGKGDGLNEIRKEGRQAAAADERQFTAKNKDPKLKLIQKLLKSECQKNNTIKENGYIQQGRCDGLDEIRRMQESISPRKSVKLKAFFSDAGQSNVEREVISEARKTFQTREKFRFSKNKKAKKERTRNRKLKKLDDQISWIYAESSWSEDSDQEGIRSKFSTMNPLLNDAFRDHLIKELLKQGKLVNWYAEGIQRVVEKLEKQPPKAESEALKSIANVAREINHELQGELSADESPI